jgi:hypothetical protein
LEPNWNGIVQTIVTLNRLSGEPSRKEKEMQMNFIQKACWPRLWLRRLLARVVGNCVVWMRPTETSRRRSSGRRLSKENHVPQSEFFAASHDHVVPALTLLDDDIGDGIWMVTLNDYGPGARDRLSFECFHTKQAAETFIGAQKCALS